MTPWQSRQRVYFMESIEQRGGRVQISESLYHELKAKGCAVWISGEPKSGKAKKSKLSPLEDVTNMTKARNGRKRRAA